MRYTVIIKHIKNMTQIVVTLEDGSNLNIIRNAINLIRGVKDTMVTHVDKKVVNNKSKKRLQAFDRLAGSVSLDMIDTEDPRTKYLLSK